MCEFVGLDLEMTIKEHYHEVLEVFSDLYIYIFDGLKERYANELDTINNQYPFEPLKYIKPRSEHRAREVAGSSLPAGVRPFYTMPDPTDKRWSHSNDMMIRGEEMVSGAQRVHIPKLQMERMDILGVLQESMRNYIYSFRLGALPHGGGGIGLERVVMLYLGLGNISKSSMFSRDPKRLLP
ncbi:aspartyl-tRNA synthetase, putative [Phytophthora infestans T30-4]|uniref:aspartate--tRNA ligase n=1 Tax=Phytophthora infestans (strain T30-4) TaxID=403677 RepID=D0P2V7_PHYIT|nr:aspartyl-tRNA synthetase, putative [Phytophthora infestans T30-4]EEY57094.1 aspartyl-tRNA synthetase, putative [Phytophthora infestans T30-4]|eukprot:XP_002895371.1 aspartyl-tRNA synthetase, putative [Phytophthora infestans T30-4]